LPLQNTKSRSQPSKKRAKKRIPKEADLDENEALVGSYVIKLNDKYVCNIQNHKHCFIKEDRHLSLNNFAISLWAKEIVCIL
jgi:hypothetical protein